MGTNEGNGYISNFEKWRYFCDGLTSPDSFVNFGYYFMIMASLQRRVWLPPSHKPIYPNDYIVFVAPPGIGKGLVITEVAKMLKYHKKIDPYENKTTITSDKTGNIVDVDRCIVEAASQADYYSAMQDVERPSSDGYRKRNQSSVEKPLLIPMAPDATSYEALVSNIARALRRKNYSEFDPILQRNVTKIYTHSSMAFCLEELSSLFRKKAEDVVRFLQITFDCGDYKKDTKTQGVDRIQKCCVSLLGGATKEFMQKLFRDELADEGFASRTIFIFETKDRKTAAFIPEHNELQKQYEKDILEHIKNLTDLYGQVEIEQEALDFIEDWHRKAQLERPNINEKLLNYYSRKKIHMLKLATAVHFGESIEMKLTKSSAVISLSLLDAVERRMHHALVSDSKNPYYKLGIKMLDFLRDNGPKTRKELLAKFWEELPTNEPHKALDTCIEHYQIMGKVNNVTEKDIVRFGVIKETETI